MYLSGTNTTLLHLYCNQRKKNEAYPMYLKDYVYGALSTTITVYTVVIIDDELFILS